MNFLHPAQRAATLDATPNAAFSRALQRVGCKALFGGANP
jgi:hypothetical protein